MMADHRRLVTPYARSSEGMQELQSGQESGPSEAEETAADHLIWDCPPAEENIPY